MRIWKKLLVGNVVMAATVLLAGGVLSWSILMVDEEFAGLSEKTLEVVQTLGNIKYAGMQIITSSNELLYISTLGVNNQETQETQENQETQETQENQKNQKNQEDQEIQEHRAGIETLNRYLTRYGHLVDLNFPDEKKLKRTIIAVAKELVDKSESMIRHDLGVGSLLHKLEHKEAFENVEQEFISTVDSALLHKDNEFRIKKKGFEDTISTILLGIGGGAVCFVILIIVFGGLLAKSITGPIDRLVKTANIIGSGNLEARASLQAHDEIGDLAVSFNQMIEDLGRTITTKEEAEARANIAKTEAENASAAKSYFLANMSHELRSPLNAIIGFSGMINHQVLGTITPPKYREYAADVNRSGTHLLGIINDLLDISVIESGGVILNEETTDLLTIVSSSMNMVSDKAEAKGLTLTKLLDNKLPALRGDRLRVTQILVNLLNNSIKFTPVKGTISVEVRADQDNRILIAVQDSGIGIAEEHLLKVLQPFGQIEDVLVRENDGIGLGLAIVNSLTELHGGEVGIESTYGVGTRVSVTFPSDRSV